MMSIMEVILMTVTPNWQHHSKKEQKRSLKPQALRQSKERLKFLLSKLNVNENHSQYPHVK